MARTNNGRLDGMSGKLGNVVTYKWKGRDCVRVWTKPKDKKSPAQMERRSIFGKMSSLGAAMLPIAKIGFRGIAAENQTTEKNIFVRLNSQYASMVDGEVEIDYSSLCVADGPLEAVAFEAPTTADGRVLRAAFSRSRKADRFDYVVLAAYLPGVKGCMLSEPVYRSAGEVEITLPESWAGLEAHLYGFSWDGKDQASPSCYVGVVNA